MKDISKHNKINFNFNNMMSAKIGEHGFDPSEIAALKVKCDKSHEAMINKRSDMKWRELPHNQAEIVDDILAYSQEVKSKFDNFVVLGIGGSALGPIAVHQALNHLRYNELPKEKRGGPKLYVEDNIDPERVQALFDVIDIEKTCFNVVTKSGMTSETMAQLLLITDKLKSLLGDKWTDHIVATTDQNKGNLIKIVKDFGLKCYFIPDGVGGRFSQLCPVGLLAAAVCSIDIKELLLGAAYADELCSQSDYTKNPAYMMAVLHYIGMKKGMNVSVMMPYSDSLKYISDWFAQLWAESLGKKYDNDGGIVNCGQTPVKALGVTDQHSQVQLYTEGPYDKIITFLGVDKYRTTCEIPNGYEDIPDVSFLGGHTFNELIKSEQQATEYAVMQSGHASYSVMLPEVNAFNIGQLLYIFEVQTAFCGELLDINAFDQPGVEAGKNATYALLGKKGFDDERKRLSSVAVDDEAYML